MKRIIVAILGVAIFVGCRKSEIQTENQSKINLATTTAAFDELHPQKPEADTKATKATKATQAQSKAQTAFAEGQKLGLFLHTTQPIGTAEKCHSRNIEYATPDGGATWHQRASLDNDLTEGTTYYATAYTPFVEATFEPAAMPVAVQKDQTTTTNFDQSDLRIARNAPLTGSGTAANTQLDFTHALAMFELKLLIPTMVEGREVDQIEVVSFEHLATQGTLDLATGAVTTDLNSVASIAPRITSGTGAIGVMTTYQAIVVPQNVDGGVLLAKIRCQMKDGTTETMDYITPSRGWISFQAGVKTSITLLPTAEAAFMGDLPALMDGQAHTDLALPIFVETGLRWTVEGAGVDWLTLSDKKGGTYAQKLSGTSATGGWQNVYIKVSANTSQAMPRTGDLTLRAWRTDGSEVAVAVLRLVQNYYTFTAVGGTWNTSSAAASDPVLPFASNQQWTAESNVDWLLLATSATVGSGNPSKKFVQAGALAEGKLFLQVAQNTTATARRGVVTISSPVVGAASMKLYVNQVGNQSYVEVNGLRWATGNLVATRSSVDGVSAAGCMIGAPDDGGLYFQFGSLIGYKGGNQDNGGTGVGMPKAPLTTNGTFWNKATAWDWKNEAMVWPSVMTTTPATWPKEATTNQWYFGLQTGWSTPNQNIRDFPNFATGGLASVGVGDPCTYYLGGNWRQPTTSELASITGVAGTGGAWVPWENVNGSWATSPVAGAHLAGDKLFFPTSGGRSTSNGSFNNVTVHGLGWSSSVWSATYGHYLIVHESSGVIPQHSHYRSYGFPVRCVEPVPTVVNPPAASDYVEVNGLYWAKGNLVATNNTSAKVGQPEDGGLYFQFGSLIGYKGGAAANNGNGVGMPDVALNSKYWGGATAWSWGNDAAVWPDKLGNQPAAWPKDQTTNQWYFGLQTGWSTAGQNIRDFLNFATGGLANVGVGDPCTYYLGGNWRQPTTFEQASMTGVTGSNWVPWADVDGSWATLPIAGGNLAGDKLFFPASGYRDYSNGSFYNVTTSGNGWSSSISNATHGHHLSVHKSYGVVPQNIGGRSYAFPVRCVATAPHKPNPPTADDYVEIDMGGGKKMKWAKGNLIGLAPHQAKVGKPEDGGLYFQFGSLIGYKGGAVANGGTGVGSNPYTGSGTQWWGGATSFSWANDAMVYPPTLSGNPTTWPQATLGTAHQWFFSGQGVTSGNIDKTDITKGVGDPCTYYLGGTWRLPKNTECFALFGNVADGTVWGSVAGWDWQASPPGAKGSNFFPASGYRDTSNGSFYNVTVYGFGWSSSVSSATFGHYLSFNSGNVYPQTSYYRSNGFPIRCVSN